MASGGAEEGDGSIPLDIDNVHMLLQVEHEQIQKRTFTNWINAQLAKRCPPTFVSDLFSDLRDGSQLLNLLEVTSGQSMKRQKGRGVFQQRTNIETALSFLKKKSIKLVNINISDIIDGRPSIILGLVWTIILRCQIEELANALSFSSRHSSLDSLASLDSWSGSPIPSSPVPAGRTSPLHRRFRISAKKALLMWVREQCQRVGSSVSVKDFKSSWRSGEAFLAILCSLRPHLVELSLAQSRSNQENLEEAFHLAERELHIPRLLEPQDVDVKDPDEKSIMTYVAQFLQYSNDMPAPDDHLQVSPSERAQEATCWLQQAFQELLEARTATENMSYAEKYQVLQSLAGSFTEQRRPVMTLLATIRRFPELSREQQALRAAWDRLEEELQRSKADLDLSLPPPVDSVVVWLQGAEAALKDEGGSGKDHAGTAKEARARQDTLKGLVKEMSHHVQILDNYSNMDESGSVVVPLEQFEEIKRRLTHIRVAAKYQGIKLEYQEHWLTVLDLLKRIKAKIQTWKSPYTSQEAVHVLLQDWHETVERQGTLLILMDDLQNLKEKANACTSKAALGEDSQLVNRQVKEAEREVELVTQAVPAVRGMMERVVSAWEIYSKCFTSLQTWLAQSQTAAGTQDMNECQAKLNEVGNFLIEVTKPSTSRSLANQLSKVNMQWAECMKRTKFGVSSESCASLPCLHMVHSLTQEASWLLRQPLDVATVPLKAHRQKLQLLSKKMAGVDVSSLSSSPEFQISHIENFHKNLPQVLAEAERTCGELQRAASRLEGRLAELDRWSTDALDCYQHLKQKEHRGHASLDTTAKVLISRGSQLENQVLTEGRDLQDFVAQVQETSPLQHLSTSGMQAKISEAVSHCQEILGMFSSLGFRIPVHQMQIQPETGLFVVSRTIQVDQTGRVKLQIQDQSQVSPQLPQRTKEKQHMDRQDETTIVIPHVKLQMLEPVLHFHSSLIQSVKEAESKPTMQPLTFSETTAQTFSTADRPSLTHAAVGPPSQKNQHDRSTAAKGEESSPSTQSHKSKPRTRGQPKSLQGDQTSPQPPVMVRSEVHSKAQSMARSRLEKARVRLHGRIQQAIKLFSRTEISESQAKKKQRALKMLQPVVLDEFLHAVDGYGAFCSGAQLQDLMLLSDSVRAQWEDVRMEMAAFIPILSSKIREGKPPFSVVQCEKHTNARHEATDQTDHDSLQQLQAAVDGAASVEQWAESVRELSETVTPEKSPCLGTEQLKESDEARDDSDTVLSADGRGRQPGGDTLLRAAGVLANTEPSRSLPQKQGMDRPQQDVSPVGGSVPRHGNITPLWPEDAPTERQDQTMQHGSSRQEENLKSSLKAQEQRLKARLLQTESNQQGQTHVQAVVRGDTMETRQEAELTIIPETETLSHMEHLSRQEVLQRYRESCLEFQSQLQKNQQHLEQLIPDPVNISTLQNQRKQLQTSKEETEALWLEFELQYALLSQSPHLMTREDLSEVERDWEQLRQEWRGQQMCLQDRMRSLENAGDIMESADDTMTVITRKLDSIVRQPVDISSFNFADHSLQTELKEMDDRLQSELSKQSNEEERQHPEATSLHQAVHKSVSHLNPLRQQLEKVQLAAQAVDHFLATVREVKAEIPAQLTNRDASRHQNEADWEQERHSWQVEMQQRLQTAVEQCDRVDSNLKAAGMTLTVDGATVTCQDVVASLSEHVADVAKNLMRATQRENRDEINPVRKEQMHSVVKLNLMAACQTKTEDESPQQGGKSEQKQEHPPLLGKAGFEAKWRRLEGENGSTQREEEHPEVQRGRSNQIKEEGDRKENSVQRTAALLEALREIKKAAEHLGLDEPSLPALHQRTRALTELESRLACLFPELQLIQGASSSGLSDATLTEVEDAWEETTKAMTEWLQQCRVLTELLKRFQSVRGELTGMLQRAESTINERAPCMGRDNLQKLHTKVQERKAELTSLTDGVEEVRNVCRQLHSHLRQIPGCTIAPFEREADALMDSWLDISERTDSHLENLDLGLSLWDGVLQLGAEVKNWTTSKLAVFAQTPSFQSEDDITTLQREIVAQEKSVALFHQRATEIQSLLQSTDPPLELQVAETQMRKKIEQLKELGSEAEDVYRQVVAAKGQISARMAECLSSIQKTEESLLALSGSDVSAVLAKLKDLCRELQTQDEQTERLLEDLSVLASVASPDSLKSLCADGTQLQEKVRNAHQVFSEVEEKMQSDIQDLDRLQREGEHLQQWLQAEEKAGKQEGLNQSVRMELLGQLVSSLQSSSLRQSVQLEEISKLLERYRNFNTDTLHGAKEKQSSQSGDCEVFRASLKSTESGLIDLRRLVGTPLDESPSICSPVEQRLHHAQAVVSATAVGEACLQQLRLTGNSLSCRLCDGDDLKQEIEESIQKTEEQWRQLQQSAEPYYRILQTEPELTSYLAKRKEVRCRVEELQRQITQIPASFPWPGTAERRQACLLARQLFVESESLQLTLTSLAEQARDLAERTGNKIWKDSSWAELDTCCFSLMTELKAMCSRLEDGVSNEEHLSDVVQHCQHNLALLQETMSACQVQKESSAQLVTDVPAVEALIQEMDKHILQLVTLKDTITDSLTVEAQASLSQEVSNLQSHKRALDSSLRENQAALTKNSNQRLQQVKEEVSCVQTAVNDLAANVGNLPESLEVLPDIGQLKQQWSIIQDSDTSLTELVARINILQKAGESSVTPERLPADVTLTVDGAAKDLDSLRTTFLQKKQQCAENTENRVIQVIRQMQQWSQTVQAEPSSPDQGVLDDGVQLQQSLREVLSEKDFLQNCLETKVSKEVEKMASDALIESTAALQALSECLMREDMEAKRTVPGLPADPGSGETTGGSPESCKPRSTMQDIFSEIRSLVINSNIINRTPHIDLNWYLKSSPGEPEIRLLRTIQQVLECRYQPAQLDVVAMAKQLQEAEEYRCCVQEQVASMKNTSAARDCDPNALKRAEGQWSAALLDASATVQVKAAQLDQVKRYHKQMKMTRAFLEVLAAEKEKMNLNALGSSAVQADKLHALLQTMEQKKSIMEDLFHLSSQLSVHLSDAESSGALLAQLGDVQEEWRLLKGSIKRALRHAANSTSQSAFLTKEAHQLKAKVEALQESNFQSSESTSALELVCLTTDLKLFTQLYLHLQSQADALVHFSLGQKEKDEIRCNLQELGFLLNDFKIKLDTSTNSRGGISSTKINKQLQDLITWAKQAENHISIGKKMALFPEEARVQIVDMKKFQTDILFQRSKMQAHIEEMKDIASDMEKEESDQVLKTVEDLYEAIGDSLGHVLDTMKKDLHEREKLLSQIVSTDAWLTATQATRDPCAHVENVSKSDTQVLESKLESHKLATAEIQRRLTLVEAMEESCKDVTAGLSPGESRYLVNRLSGLWTELDGLLAHEKATSWELEELINERISSNEELSTIEDSLKQIYADLEQQRFPSTQETLSAVVHLKHMLTENQCQVQELQHCHEAKRSALLYTIGELQDKCKALGLNALEQDKYLHLRRLMEESRDIANEQIQRAKDKTISVGERFRLCQAILVELPLVKTQCQEAGDQLEAIAQELSPSELNSEKQRIHNNVSTLVSWEHSVTDDIKNLETELLLDLRFSSELPALMELFQKTREELLAARPVNPDEKEIDSALRRHWVVWRNMESGMRVVEALGRKENVNLKNHVELYSLRDAVLQECHLRMECISQARESLKDFQWAAQGAIAFLHNAEATFLSAPGGFLDCTEEQRQTQQALEALEDGFQAHIQHLVELVPQQPCLSRPDMEQLHIRILSQLLVGRAVLEAQAQLRLESLQRCAVREKGHTFSHEDIRQRLSKSEAALSQCAAAQVTSYDKCVAHQKRAKLLMEDLHHLAGTIEELRAGCPMQGCGVGKDGELAALWRRWVSLRRGVGVLIAHAEQGQEEWKDITISMEQCCSFLANLQAEVPDSSSVSFTQEKPQEVLAQAEVLQAGLEQEQQALASLEHRLEHALSLSSSQDPMSPGPVGKTLVKIQENVRSLKERNQLVVAAAQAEEKERLQVQEEMAEVEKHIVTLLPALEACSNPSEREVRKELRENLSKQKEKLKHVTDGIQSRYEEIPVDIRKRLQELQLTIQRAEEKLMEESNPVRTLAGRVMELCSGLEKVKASLDQKSPSVTEAQNTLKRVWDQLDGWRSRLMLLESEVQDVAEEQPDHAHLLMDQLTQPLQLHQNVSQLAEQRTSFLSKIPACLQELEDVSYSATCWLDEAQSWLSAPCSFTTARSLQNHANSLQLVLDESERIRDTLQGFRPVLAEISAVCDIKMQENQLEQNYQQMHKMQRNLLEPLEQLLQAAAVVEVMEAELKMMEKNVPKIRTILSSMDDLSITPVEHLHNRQVILANVQSMRRTLVELDRCRAELQLPQGAGKSLLAFSQARLLLQQLEELEQLTQQQASLLEEGKETSKDLGIAKVQTSIPQESEQLNRSPSRLLAKQEAFEVSNSEEEEEGDDESCHSSSSDTLTCSIPEDLVEVLSVSDVTSEDIAEMKPLSKVKELKSSAHQFSSQVGMSSKGAESESGLSSAKSGCDTEDFSSTDVETGLGTMDHRSAFGKSPHPKTLTAEALVPLVPPAAKDQFTASSKSPQAPVATEGTRLIPTRPKAPFTPTRESVATESGGHEEDEKGRQRWCRLFSQISQRLTSLKKLQQEHQTSIKGTREEVPKKEPMSTGSVSAVLQRTHESITMLRQTMKSADGSHPGVKEELYEALRRVVLCLDTWTDLLLAPGGAAGEGDPLLRLLHQECVSTELMTLAELLNKVESETRPALSEGEPGAYRCVTCLQDCLSTAQLISTASNSPLTEHQIFKQFCILDEFEAGQRETFQSLKHAPSLELCVLGRHLKGSPQEKAMLQQASCSSLQGIAHILELGEDSLEERQMSQGHIHSQLQALLRRHEKLPKVLGSHLACVQYLFQREPDVLKCQEYELAQLKVRAEVLQQQSLEEEVASRRRLQEWTSWQDKCDRLGQVLDEFEAVISNGEPEGDEEEESVVQHRLDACQKTLAQLNDSRADLGLLMDQCKALQTEPVFAASVGRGGGALELRWRNALRRTEQEIQRCKSIQDIQPRFHADFTSVSNWLVGANKRLKTWSVLANTSELDWENFHNNVIKLLDFTMEVEAMSVQKTFAAKRATQLLHLREADCPGLRAQMTQLQVSWSQLTSHLSKIQDQLHQRLLAEWPPVDLLSDVEEQLMKLDARLSQEKEGLLKAKDAAQIAEVLQHYKELKAGVVSGQLLLDFLCQSGPQAVTADVLAARSERTKFAETLGAIRFQWLNLQTQLESQIHGAEQMHHTCAARERRLQHLHGWTEQQKKKLSQCEQPISQTLAQQTLQEWEAVAARVKEVAASLQEMMQVRDEKGQNCPCDIAFWNQAESVSHSCEDLTQQMEALRPALQHTVSDWSCFDRTLREVTLHTSRVRCALQQQRQVPLFSVKQAEGYMAFLQELQRKAGKAEELWAAVEKSLQSLQKQIHGGTAQAVGNQVEGEKKQWSDTVQELKDEHLKTAETISLWQEYNRLSDGCSLHLQRLWLQWEELSGSSPSREQDAQTTVDSVAKLQVGVDVLQSSVGDVLEASKPLTERQRPPTANLIQSETRLLSRDVSLLCQAISGKKKSLQDDLEEQKQFHICLQSLEKQIKNIEHKIKAGISDSDSVKQVLVELSDLFPSLLHVRETGNCLTLNDQEREKLNTLCSAWAESTARTSSMNRERQAENQCYQTFQEKCKDLTFIKEKIVKESSPKIPQSISSVQEMLTAHQRLQAEMISGHQILQSLLCDAVKSMEKETGEKRSELMDQVAGLREGWFSAVALVGQRRSLVKEELRQQRIYHLGLKRLWRLLGVVDLLLPPAGPALCSVLQSRNCADDYQCVEQALSQHSTVYNQTLEAGKHLCETMTESECQSGLRSECRALEEAWDRTGSQLEKRRDLVNTTVQKWSRCQDGMASIKSDLDEVKTRMKQELRERPDELVQETELSLQRLASRLDELGTMKTDLSQYITAGDSALLEQQLEQLHTQWEELCMKVSLHRQEIADRLNAWTIFNDKNKEFCDWLTQMENKVCHHSGDLSIEEMVEKLKKDCMEEINLFSENKSHLKQLGEQLLSASDEAKQTQVRGSLQEVNQRWHSLFHHIEARVKKLKETLVTVQQLDKNMSNLRSWLSRIEAELSRPITYSVCHHQEIQRRLAEQQELQRDIEQHTEGVASVLSLCDVLLRDEDAAGGTEAENDSLQETSRSLDHRWRTICALALDRRLRIEETWRLWCKFLEDYSGFEDWLKMAERTAASPNSADVLYTVAKEELKKFEGFQRQVHERLTQLELVNNQYRRLARENRTDRASQLKAMVHEGNRRWDALHRRVAAIIRRLKYFTSQREDFEGTRESMLMWLTELDLQLTNVEHFSESDVHHKIQQLNSFQKEITLNTERIDGLIVFGESLIQKSSPQDAALIEDELEELHTYCQEVFSRLVRFHQRLSQPPMITEEPELSTFSLESSLELIGRPWLGRSQGSFPATPIHLLTSPLERSGTPVSVNSLPLEWDHTGDVGGSSTHEDDDDEDEEEEGPYFSVLSSSSRSLVGHDPEWGSPAETQPQLLSEATPTLTSTPIKQGYLGLMSQCSGSIEDIKRVSLILDDEEPPKELGLTGLSASDKQSGVIERWELLQAQSRTREHPAGPQEPADLDDISSWLENVIPELGRLQLSNPAANMEDMEARATELKEMQKKFIHYKPIMLSLNLRAQEAPEQQERLARMNRDWSRACTGLQQWDASLRSTLIRCQEFHETLHSLLLWLAHAESRRYVADIRDPDTPVRVLQQQHNTLTELREDLRGRQTQQASLQALWSQLRPEDGAEDVGETQEKLHVTASKLRLLLRNVDQDLSVLQQRLDGETASGDAAACSKKSSPTQRGRRDASPPRSFFYRVLRAAFPLHLLLLLLLLLPCLIPLSESDSSCTVTNNFARSFYPMLRYTNGPPPT